MQKKSLGELVLDMTLKSVGEKIGKEIEKEVHVLAKADVSALKCKYDEYEVTLTIEAV